MSEKTKTTVYIDKSARERLKNANINISAFVNDRVCEKARELAGEKEKLEHEIKNLEEEIKVKKKTLEQVEEENKELEKFLKKPRVHGRGHLEYYDKKRNNGWTAEQEQDYLAETADRAPVQIGPDSLRNKMEALLNDSS